jgi:hypothetical protein
VVRSRDIAVLRLAARIEKEVSSGRVDDVDMDDAQIERIASMLRPAPARAAACALERARWAVAVAAPQTAPDVGSAPESESTSDLRPAPAPRPP